MALSSPMQGLVEGPWVSEPGGREAPSLHLACLYVMGGQASFRGGLADVHGASRNQEQIGDQGFSF